MKPIKNSADTPAPPFTVNYPRTGLKETFRDRVATKMGEKMHTSRKVAIEQFPYFEIMFEGDDLARDLADYFDLDDAEVKQFRKRKIKKRKTKKAPKTKTKGHDKSKAKTEPK